MLVRGTILLAALLTVAANAAPIKEIQEDVVDGSEQLNNSRGLQSRYGSQPNYSGANRYNEAKKYTTPGPTPNPSSYTAPTDTGGTSSTYRGTVYTDDDGRTYVIRKRNGVENKVYTDTPGWNGGGRQYRQQARTGTGNGNGATRPRWGNGNRPRNGNRPKWGAAGRPARPGGRNWSAPTTPAKKDDWSPPAADKEEWSPPTPNPTPWRPDGWRPGYPNIPTYQGNYNPSYMKTADPTVPEPTQVPTWGDDGHNGQCDEPFKSSCCIQGDYYSFDQKQSLCRKLGCDYLKCYEDNKNDDDAWKSGNEPTAVPTWNTDGHDPTAMPIWDTDAWEDDTWTDDKDEEECKGAARTACCSQTKGDDATKSKMCDRLGCDYNKCQKEAGWHGDTHEPTELPTSEPSDSPTISHVPTWSADGHDDDKDEDTDDWAGDGQCSKDEQDRCCSQHESKSLEIQAKVCKNKFGCSILKCPQHREGWNGDEHDDDEQCSKDEQDSCCSQDESKSLEIQAKVCKNEFGCSIFKCPQHRQGWNGDDHDDEEDVVVWNGDDHDDEEDVVGWNGDDHDDEEDVVVWNGDDHEDEDTDDWTGDGQCSADEQDRCCSQHESKSLETQAKNCKNKFGCSVFKCPQYRQGADGWYGDSFENLEWDDDGHQDDTCTSNEQAKCCEQHDGVSITKQQQICKNMWNCSLLKCPKHRQADYFEQKDDGYDDTDSDYYEDECSKDDMISCCSQHPAKPFAAQYSFCTKRGCDLHKCDVAWYEEDEDRCTEEEHYNCCTQPESIGIGIQHENCVKTGCSLFKCVEDEEDYNEPQNKWNSGEKPKFQFGYGGDDSTCSDGDKWQCCSPHKSILGSYKSIVKNCQNLGCEWGQCPQNRDDELYDNQFYYDTSYEYGGGYDTNYQCTDAGKWNCCNPDSSLTGLKGWVRNCQAHSCEWQKCPHHRQGYYDPKDPTVDVEKQNRYQDTDYPTPSPIDQCTEKEQSKCCNYQGTLKQAAKYCQSLECDIADCNKPVDHDYDGGYNIDVNRDGYVSYGDGGNKPAGNTGPRPDDGYGDNDYSDYGDGDRPQGNTGPRPAPTPNGGNGGGNTGPSPATYRNGGYDDEVAPVVRSGNTGPRNPTNNNGDNFLNQGVDENCEREFTAGGACRLTCTTKVEYKLMGVVMSTHDETTTKPCS
eukprot:CAMPEP_0113423166 /NCGR_PEP_ID=MMETSP0013_2-20120614/28867_1 /TAXON_ID=2843 ORGANISM="Skeletonema costatum, Strain 1716" /NCGR_SAMPLE_ID=MMETSP0013_2 /ASSEMBLY_ACC=CAM_ASM_000158 /LENGTH=1165 /DNA_ID=CAMNT_0000310995 /DNA_START=136 /DNA_END=3633 /DNA_ORIENTATION=+ /assembly_acc=CAM_ASM_000158